LAKKFISYSNNMVEYKEGVGINFTDILREEHTERTKAPEALSGREVADEVEQLFAQASDKLKPSLVQSNVVLTLAGMKPMTEFFVTAQTDQEAAELQAEAERLNAYLNTMNPEIKFGLAGVPFNSARDKKERIQMVTVQNLLGWERISKTSHLPGVTPFNRKEGWKEFAQWRFRMINGIEKAQTEKALPEGIDVLAGFSRGYPDTAILDFADWLAKDKKITLQDSEIPYTGIYREAEPNFDFYPEHADDPAIRSYIDDAGKILKEFYESNWHKSNEHILSPHRQINHD